MAVEIEVTSFHGTDACGKSTIAERFASQAQDLSGERAVLLGGSSYKEWLNRRVARSVFGNARFMDESANTPPEKRRLYENIAITTYGFADRLRRSGAVVVIDSDPFLKRLVWSGLEIEDEIARKKYIEEFNKRMTEVIGADTAPKNVVGINVSKVNADLLARIEQRGGISEYDPGTAEELSAMNFHIMEIWGDLKAVTSGSKGVIPAIERRFSRARLTQFENPDCSPDQVFTQTQSIARRALEWAMLK